MGHPPQQPRYKSKFAYSDAEYFNLSEKDMRIAAAARDRPVPTLPQIHRTIELMPDGTEIAVRVKKVAA